LFLLDELATSFINESNAVKSTAGQNADSRKTPKGAYINAVLAKPHLVKGRDTKYHVRSCRDMALGVITWGSKTARSTQAMRTARAR